MSGTWRERAAKGMAGYFQRRRWPRLSLGLVVILTGAAGLGISYGLLKFGLTEMWQRYPLAVFGAYGVFLALLRIWVEIERAHFDPEDPEVLQALKEGASEERVHFDPEGSEVVLKEGAGERRARKGDRWSWLDQLDIPDGLDGIDSLEGCAVGVLLVAAIGLIVTLIVLVAGAPMLVGEVAVDVFLVSILYRRLKAAEREHWLSAAVRRTWLHMLAVAALLAIAGGCVGILVPGSVSIADAFREWRAR